MTILSLLALACKILLGILFFIFLSILVGFLYTRIHPVFGGVPDAVSSEKIQHSPQFDGKKFKNFEPVSVMTPNTQTKENGFSPLSLLFPPEGKRPSRPLPSEKLDKYSLKNNSYVWLGHSTILIKLNDQTILADPVFYRASPIPLTIEPFKFQHPTRIEDLPKINIVLITHDHYDHLDYRSIKELGNEVEKYIVPLGVKADLQRWGIEGERIIEMDWYESATLQSVTYTFTPAQHFSGRNLDDRNSTLWGGWIIKDSTQKIYISGDGGYSAEFKKIGESYGPFNIAFLENGAYSQSWRNIHMMPEESVQAGIDLRAKFLVPIHWAKFDLAPHKWDEPIFRFTKAAKQKKIPIATPVAGKVFDLKNIPIKNWWHNF